MELKYDLEVKEKILYNLGLTPMETDIIYKSVYSIKDGNLKESGNLERNNLLAKLKKE